LEGKTNKQEKKINQSKHQGKEAERVEVNRDIRDRI
jgi:hypothetical protein